MFLIPFILKQGSYRYVKLWAERNQKSRPRLSYYYWIFLPPQDYSTLRLILSLVGDIYNLLTPLTRVDQNELMELSPYVNSLFNEADKFRNVRNCFTHLDEIFTDMDKHGITGAAKTNCGIEYMPSAKGCVHLVWADNVIHFTYWGKAKEATIEKSSFDNIFKIATKMYSELISHKMYAGMQNYKPPDQKFPSWTTSSMVDFTPFSNDSTVKISFSLFFY